jgi:hypothetical protein
MSGQRDVDDLIREELWAEGVEGLERLGEPTLPEMVTEFLSSTLRWYGVMFLGMILVFSVVAVWCGIRFFLGSSDVPEMLRWGAGMFIAWSAVMGGKVWYWGQMERITLTREIKRVEVMVAQLAHPKRERSA